jgi:hypothetical protein
VTRPVLPAQPKNVNEAFPLFSSRRPPRPAAGPSAGLRK